MRLSCTRIGERLYESIRFLLIFEYMMAQSHDLWVVISLYLTALLQMIGDTRQLLEPKKS